MSSAQVSAYYGALQTYMDAIGVPTQWAADGKLRWRWSYRSLCHRLRRYYTVDSRCDVCRYEFSKLPALVVIVGDGKFRWKWIFSSIRQHPRRRYAVGRDGLVRRSQYSRG